MECEHPEHSSTRVNLHSNCYKTHKLPLITKPKAATLFHDHIEAFFVSFLPRHSTQSYEIAFEISREKKTLDFICVYIFPPH